MTQHTNESRTTTGKLIPDEAVEGAALKPTADPPDGSDLRYLMLGDLIVAAIAGEVLPDDGYCDNFEQATLRAVAEDLKALIIALSHDGYAQDTSPPAELSAYELRGALSRLALRASAAAELGARMRRSGRPEQPEGTERYSARNPAVAAAIANGNGHAVEVQ